MLNVVMRSVAFIYYGECRYAECRGTLFPEVINIATFHPSLMFASQAGVNPERAHYQNSLLLLSPQMLD
jgi:hypothetical protein